MSIGRQAGALRGGAEVVVATPGRLKDLIERGDCRLDQVAHHRAGRGRPDGRHGLHAAGHRAARPGAPRRASGCCSRPPWTATSTCWSAATCTDPVVHSVDPSAGAVTTMEHHVLHVHGADKHAADHRDRRPRRPGDHVPGHQARRRPAHQAPAEQRRTGRRPARRQVPAAAHPHPGPVQDRARHRAGGHQRRGPRHPRRQPRPRRQRRPADRPQGLPAPRRPYRPRRRVRQRRHPGHCPTSAAT